MITHVKYAFARFWPVRGGQAGFWTLLASIGLPILGSLLGVGEQPSAPSAPPPPESGLGKMLPVILIAGGAVVMIIVLLMFMMMGRRGGG